MADIDRVKTGIPGFDTLVEGGFPEGSVVLLSGGAGCGKTLFCSHFLWNGLEAGERCRFISMEEAVEDIKGDAAVFGWDFENYQDGGGPDEEAQFKITYIEPTSGERGFLRKVNDLAREGDVSRLVIDSISIMLGAFGGDESEMRDNMYSLMRNVKQSGATTILTSEIREAEGDTLSRYNVAEFVTDGVIKLYYEGIAEGNFRNLEVRKMRRTAHTPGTFPFNITDDGIEVLTDNAL